MARALVFVHGMALIAAIANPLPLWAKLALAACTLGSLWFSFHRHILKPAVDLILIRTDAPWALGLRNGSTVDAKLLGTTLTSAWFTLLHLRTAAGTLAVLLCRDSLDAEAYRLLRVSLKVNAVGRDEVRRQC